MKIAERVKELEKRVEQNKRFFEDALVRHEKIWSERFVKYTVDRGMKESGSKEKAFKTWKDGWDMWRKWIDFLDRKGM